MTDIIWEQHLEGIRPLGIIPIRANNTCLWGCIDIDSYDVSFAELVKIMVEHDLARAERDRTLRDSNLPGRTGKERDEW